MMPLMAAPPQVRWNYTYACNFNCTHCYTRAAWYPAELSTAAYERIADQLIEAGVFVVGFGGGEVLLRRDCVATIAKLSAAGIHTVLTSNGWLLDDRRAARLAAAGLGRLKVSLDSPVLAEHDAFRNRPSSYTRVIGALNAGVRAGLPVYLSSVLTAINQDSIDGFVTLARQTGIAGIGFIPFRPAGKGARVRSRYELDERQQQDLQARVAALRQESGLDLVLSGDSDGDLAEQGCGCGVMHLTIRPNGDLSPCNFAEAVIGNITQSSLIDLWRNSPALWEWRTRGGCSPGANQPAPSNPGAPAAADALPVIEVA